MEPTENQAQVPEIIEKNAVSDASAAGLARMERLLAQKFTEEKILGMIDDLCQANDKRMNKLGDVIETPNWPARETGLKHVLQLRRFVRKNDPVSGEGAPIKLVFNVTSPNITVAKNEDKKID